MGSRKQSSPTPQLLVVWLLVVWLLDTPFGLGCRLANPQVGCKWLAAEAGRPVTSKASLTVVRLRVETRAKPRARVAAREEKATGGDA